MSQDGLYDFFAHNDCLPREGDNFEIDVEGEALATLTEWADRAMPPGTAWLDALVERRENALEAMLREKLGCPPEQDLLDAALQEQFIRNKYNMHPLVI